MSNQSNTPHIRPMGCVEADEKRLDAAVERMQRKIDRAIAKRTKGQQTANTMAALERAS